MKCQPSTQGGAAPKGIRAYLQSDTANQSNAAFHRLRTLLGAVPTLTAQYDQHYHRLVPSGNVFGHVCRPYTGCRPFQVPPPGPVSNQKVLHVDPATFIQNCRLKRLQFFII